MKYTNYYYKCFDKCFSNYYVDIDKEEKICLAQCSDTLHSYLGSNYDDLLKVKSVI